MGTNELRIGNYINYNYLGVTIVSMIESGEDITQASSNEYYPIPLTEEWILKLGFAVRYFNEDKNKPLWWKSEGNRHIDIYFEKQVSAYVFMINSLQYSVPLINVHQLQNLYFALTGQELTIKQ